jgi:hypothetical protein
MAKFCFVSDQFFPVAYAGGNCSKNIITALHKKHPDYDITVIFYRQPFYDYDSFLNVDFEYETIKPSIPLKLRMHADTHNNVRIRSFLYLYSKLLNKIYRVVHLPLFPVNSIFMMIKYFFTIRKIVLSSNEAHIVAFYAPFDGMLAARLVKVFYPQVKLTNIFLDSLSGYETNNIFLKFMYSYFGRYWEYFLMKGGVNICMNSHKNRYLSSFYSKCNIKFADIPTFTSSGFLANGSSYSINNWLFYGSLSCGLRNPMFAVKVFHELYSLSRVNKFTMAVRGSCFEVLSSISSSTPNLNIHGFLSDLELDRKIKEADVFVNIGNSHGDFIHSKIFDYMGRKRVIIHFQKQSNDPVSSYINKYPLGLCIEESLGIDNAVLSITNFIKKIRGQDFSTVRIDDLFKDNRPEFYIPLLNSN